MGRTRRTIRLEEEHGTSGAGGWGRSEVQGISDKITDKRYKEGKVKEMGSAVTAAKLERKNQKVRQGSKDKMERGWMKSIKRVTNTGIKQWRPGTNAL